MEDKQWLEIFKKMIEPYMDGMIQVPKRDIMKLIEIAEKANKP